MTLKAIALMPRRPDLSRAQFRDYYEQRHTPLALRYFSFAKYLRNHLLDGDDIGFDSLSEFLPRRADATASLMQGPVGERMREDERQFTDQPAIRVSRCQEILLHGPPRSADETGSERLALMLETTLELPALTAALHHWATGIDGRVQLDSLLGFEHAHFPCDAFLWLEGAGLADAERSPLPDGVRTVGRFRSRTAETPADVLAVSGTETLP